MAHSSQHGINSLLSRGNFLWNNLPRKLKKNVATEEFKKYLKEQGTLLSSLINLQEVCISNILRYCNPEHPLVQSIPSIASK